MTLTGLAVASGLLIIRIEVFCIAGFCRGLFLPLGPWRAVPPGMVTLSARVPALLRAPVPAVMVTPLPGLLLVLPALSCRLFCRRILAGSGLLWLI
jgi:hypothetical protein